MSVVWLTTIHALVPIGPKSRPPTKFVAIDGAIPLVQCHRPVGKRCKAMGNEPNRFEPAFGLLEPSGGNGQGSILTMGSTCMHIASSFERIAKRLVLPTSILTTGSPYKVPVESSATKTGSLRVRLSLGLSSGKMLDCYNCPERFHCACENTHAISAPFRISKGKKYLGNL